MNTYKILEGLKRILNEYQDVEIDLEQENYVSTYLNEDIKTLKEAINFIEALS